MNLNKFDLPGYKRYLKENKLKDTLMNYKKFKRL